MNAKTLSTRPTEADAAARAPDTTAEAPRPDGTGASTDSDRGSAGAAAANAAQPEATTDRADPAAHIRADYLRRFPPKPLAEMTPEERQARKDAANKAAAEALAARKAAANQAAAEAALARRTTETEPAQAYSGSEPRLETMQPATVVNVHAHQPDFLAARRRERGRKFAIIYTILVIVPTLLTALYYSLIASDRYVSETRLTVRDMTAPRFGGLETALANSFGGSTAQNIKIVQEFYSSREVVERLEREIGLSKLYSVPEADWLSRLPSDASIEDLAEYYLGRTDFTLDEAAGTLKVEAQAFTPEDARTIARALVRFGDELISGIADTAREDAISFARTEVAEAERRLKEATDAINSFQVAKRQLDPTRSASDALSIIAQLEGQLATARAELAQQSTYMRADSAAITALRARVTALEDQVERQRAELTGRGGDFEYPDVLGKFQRLKTEFELAEKGFVSAVTSLEVARLQAQQKQIYLVPFVTPGLASEPEYPRPIFNTFSVFLGANMLLGILALILAAIREHADD